MLRILRCLLLAMIGAITSYLLQISYMFLNNSLKGVSVNPDGQPFIAIGILVLTLLIISSIIILSILWWKQRMAIEKFSRKSSVIAILSFLIGIVISVIIWEVLYSSSHILNVLF